MAPATAGLAVAVGGNPSPDLTAIALDTGPKPVKKVKWIHA